MSKIKKSALAEEKSTDPVGVKPMQLVPQSPSEFIKAGYSLVHVSEDGLMFIMKKGHSISRVQCTLYREAGTGTERIIVSSVLKVP